MEVKYLFESCMHAIVGDLYFQLNTIFSFCVFLSLCFYQLSAFSVYSTIFLKTPMQHIMTQGRRISFNDIQPIQSATSLTGRIRGEFLLNVVTEDTPSLPVWSTTQLVFVCCKSYKPNRLSDSSYWQCATYQNRPIFVSIFQQNTVFKFNRFRWPLSERGYPGYLG